MLAPTASPAWLATCRLPSPNVAEDEIVYITAPVGFRPPAEFVKKHGPKCVWLMKKVLYGRRKAAQ
eukprot:15422564-Alexandrium_andersonii.AAC.1